MPVACIFLPACTCLEELHPPFAHHPWAVHALALPRIVGHPLLSFKWAPSGCGTWSSGALLLADNNTCNFAASLSSTERLPWHPFSWQMIFEETPLQNQADQRPCKRVCVETGILVFRLPSTRPRGSSLQTNPNHQLGHRKK